MAIQGPADRVTGVATTVAEDGNWTVVTYQKTAVVKFTEKTIKLNTGGWRTQTTKRRMNQAANQFGLGFEVVEHKNAWTIKYGDEEIPFEKDEVTLRRG